MNNAGHSWAGRVVEFIDRQRCTEGPGFASVPGGPITLYGTSYALLTKYYLGGDDPPSSEMRDFILGCQDEATGLMIGPELRGHVPASSAVHDREHLLWHLTCAAIPVCLQYGMKLSHAVKAAHRFCDLVELQSWLDRRRLERAWLEGNNLLFAGQLVVYLRNVERHPSAQPALDLWFEWLDRHVDPATSLWGTDGHCSAAEAVYGGYHQLLAYYHEDHPLANPRGLVDTVLGLQHNDGGFHPHGNGGACEDVDSVDILVNAYKRLDYRCAEIRGALRRCLRHILATQNPDGGFPYNRDCPQSHMGVPGTAAAPNRSTTFATWFRTHTLALMAEILTDEPSLQFPFRFTNNLSMGWHRAWDKRQHQLSERDRMEELEHAKRWKRREVGERIRTPWRWVWRHARRLRSAVQRMGKAR
jgi:hypothetical protein